MSLHGIRTIGGERSLSVANLDTEIATFLVGEGFSLDDGAYRTTIEISEHKSEWQIAIYGDRIVMRQRYGGGGDLFKFSDSSTFVVAYNQMVEALR